MSKVFSFLSRHKKYSIAVVCGLILLALSLAVRFPLWLWLIPVALYFLPQLAIILRPYQRKMLILAIGLTAAYLLIMGLRIYRHADETTPAPEIPQAEVVPSGVIVAPEAYPKPDEKPAVLRELQKKVEELKTLVDKL